MGVYRDILNNIDFDSLEVEMYNILAKEPNNVIVSQILASIQNFKIVENSTRAEINNLLEKLEDGSEENEYIVYED